MTIKERLQDRLKDAMRGKDKHALTAVRMILARMKNAEIDAGHPLSDAETTQVLVSLSKQYHDSIDQFTKGGREDLVEKERAELSVLEEFLPKALTAEELEALIRGAIAETGATGVADLGKVMKVLIPRTVGRADGKQVSTQVRSALEGKA